MTPLRFSLEGHIISCPMKNLESLAARRLDFDVHLTKAPQTVAIRRTVNAAQAHFPNWTGITTLTTGSVAFRRN